MLFLDKRILPKLAGGLALVVSLSTCTTEQGIPVLPDESSSSSSVSEPLSAEYRKFFELEVQSDPELALYRNASSRELVIAHFTRMTGARIAKAILANCDRYDVPPALAFALAHEESDFNPKAVNRNPDSIDRGLFQLNSKSFSFLRERDFYDVEINARYGIAHLSFCLKTAGNEVSALAMYNAGTTRVSSGGTPRRTLDYVSRILKFRGTVESDFALNVTSRNLESIDRISKAGKL